MDGGLTLELVFSTLLKTMLYGGVFATAGLIFADASLYGYRRRLELNSLGLAAFTGLIAATQFCFLFLRLGGGFDAPTLSALFGSAAGLSLILQFVSAVAIGLGGTRPLIRLAGAVGLVAGLAFSGHMAARAGVGGAIFVGLHIGLATWWFGGLWRLLSLESPTELGEVARRFSQQAFGAVLALVMAGPFMAVILLGTEIDLSQPYVGWLALKVALVAGLLGLAAFNRWRLVPRLKESEAAGTLLRRVVKGEVGLFGAVLVVTACLTTLSAPVHRFEAPVLSEAAPPVVEAGALRISHYAMRATRGTVPVSAIYLTVDNTGKAPDRLLSAQCACAETASLHIMSMKDGLMGMAPAPEGFSVPAQAGLVLAPMGAHIMLTGTNRPLVEGERQKVILTFEREGRVELDIPVTGQVSAHSHSH
jgi:copper(I)-binding protein/putative copper export protein